VSLKLLYTEMVPGDALDPAFLARMRQWRCGFRDLPDECGPLQAAELHGAARQCAGRPSYRPGSFLAPSLAYMDSRLIATRDCRGLSREPIIEMLIPSTLDDSLAPPGAHVASLFCQHVAPQLPDGRSWNDCREERGRTLMIRYGRALCARIQGQRHRPRGAEARSTSSRSSA